MSKGYSYSGSSSYGNVAWYSGNSNGKPHPVKEKQCNEIGIYDMAGNVAEYVNYTYIYSGTTLATYVYGGYYASNYSNINSDDYDSGIYTTNKSAAYGFRLAY